MNACTRPSRQKPPNRRPPRSLPNNSASITSATSSNHERPHQAPGQIAPAAVYTPSARAYPARLQDPLYASDFDLRRVRSNGEIKWQGELIFIARPLVGELIGLHEDANGDAALYFGPVQLGTIDGATLKFAPRAPRPLSSRARNPKASCPPGPQPLGLR